MSGKNETELRHYGKLFHKLSNKLKRMGDENLAKHNITFSQLKVVCFVSKNSNAVLQSDIEKEFGVRRSSVTSILKNMESRRFIVRTPSPEDKRTRIVSLTDEGKKLDLDLKSYIANVENEIDRGFTEEEKDKFRLMLERALDNLDKLEDTERISQ